MSTRLALAAALGLFATATVEAQVVHPNIYATTLGATNNSWPFAYTNGAGTYQQSYDASQFPGAITISQLGFRYQTDAVRSGGSVDCKISLSYCSGPYNALSATFAANVGANSTVVFDGIASIPPFTGDPATPNAFSFLIPLTAAFPYDPAQGDLLMEVEVRVAGSGSWAAFSRCAAGTGQSRVYANTGNIGNVSGTVGQEGLITLFDGAQCAGRAISSGTGCNDSTATQLRMSTIGCPDRTTTFGLELETGAANQAPVIFLMGISDQNWLGIQLPLDLGLFGANGCSLYVSQEALVGPFSNPGGGASFQAQIPNDPSLTLGTSYWQGMIIDFGANSLGLATSNTIAVTIG